MFRVSGLFSVSSGLVAIAGSTVGRMFEDRLTLLQIRLDVADEFLGFRFEAAGHVGHVTRRDVCGCFRFVRVTGQHTHTQLASDIYVSRSPCFIHVHTFSKRAEEESVEKMTKCESFVGMERREELQSRFLNRQRRGSILNWYRRIT